MHCHSQRDPPCSPVDLCSVSAHFVLSPPSRVSASAVVSPPEVQDVTLQVTCDNKLKAGGSGSEDV